MRKMTIAALALIAIVFAVDARSQVSAEVQYPWCAEYRNSIGATNCGFVTYRQCLETISGVGGYCYRNPAYHPPRASRSSERR